MFPLACSHGSWGLNEMFTLRSSARQRDRGTQTSFRPVGEREATPVSFYDRERNSEAQADAALFGVARAIETMGWL